MSCLQTKVNAAVTAGSKNMLETSYLLSTFLVFSKNSSCLFITQLYSKVELSEFLYSWLT